MCRMGADLLQMQKLLVLFIVVLNKSDANLFPSLKAYHSRDELVSSLEVRVYVPASKS